MPLKLTTYYRGSKVPDLPGTNTFHSTELFRIYEATPGYTPILIVASEDDKPVAKLLAAICKSVRMFPPGIIKRCEVYGTGEYFNNEADKENIFSDMLQRLTNEALRDSFLIEFRNLENAMFGYKSFRDNQYIAINWLRVRNSLHSVEKVEERFSPSRIRQIKKGLKNGAQVREARTKEEILCFAQMLRHVYSSKIRRHFPSIKFFQHLENQLTKGQQSKIFIVTYKEKSSAAAPAFIQMTTPTYGSPAACARLTPYNIRAFLPYGKHWMMPSNADTATWNSWTWDFPSASMATVSSFSALEENKAAPDAGSVSVGTG